MSKKYHRRHKQTHPPKVVSPAASPMPQQTSTSVVVREDTFRTIGQRYAQAAWQTVEERIQTIDASLPNEQEKTDELGLAYTQPHTRYRARCRSMAVMIHQCGLAQAVAFCQSKASQSGDPYQYGAWLQDVENVMHLQADQLATDSRTKDLQTYMHRTHQVLHAASWLKSYAEARIKRGDDNDDRGEDE